MKRVYYYDDFESQDLPPADEIISPSPDLGEDEQEIDPSGTLTNIVFCDEIKNDWTVFNSTECLDSSGNLQNIEVLLYPDGGETEGEYNYFTNTTVDYNTIQTSDEDIQQTVVELPRD